MAPLPPGLVERWYSRGAYPYLQHALTRLSNLVPLSLFDAMLIGGIIAVVLTVYRGVHRAGWRAGLTRAGVSILQVSAVLYLLFLCTWGLNYRRVQLPDKIAFDASRITPAARRALAARTAAELNRLYAPAHAAPASLDGLADAFREAQGALDAPVAFVPGRPKPTLLGGYFHAASIAGMTDPFFLEITVAPDLLEVERPFVIAHEWGHLSGYADESEASFIAWLACMRADPAAQYSAWLALVGHVGVDFSRAAQPGLDIGPRIDIYAIQTRYRHTNGFLRFAASRSYDKYLKANHVANGIESYDSVLQLLLGATYDREWTPRLR